MTNVDNFAAWSGEGRLKWFALLGKVGRALRCRNTKTDGEGGETPTPQRVILEGQPFFCRSLAVQYNQSLPLTEYLFART